MMLARAKALALPVDINDLSKNEFRADALNIQPIPLIHAVSPGRPSAGNAGYVLQTLEQALADCVAGDIEALITGPVNKATIIESGVAFTGHTEWLAARTDCQRVVMMLASGSLRIALATTHLPISAVPAAINTEMLCDTLWIMNSELKQKFGIDNPRIAVCGLNPHAGENGHLGMEEIEIIEPAIKKLVNEGLDLIGPVPADTAFTPRLLDQVDAVLAMFHDQGLPVIKHTAFDSAVNITLGLPIIRTSVDHGTAFDLAATGNADPSSLLAAIHAAAALAARS